jgi:peptidylprolyl isomerase
MGMETLRLAAGRDRTRGEAWLAHCYAMVGVGRANEPESGNGAELYVVIGHAPRQLDRNIAVAGRVGGGRSAVDCAGEWGRSAL